MMQYYSGDGTERGLAREQRGAGAFAALGAGALSRSSASPGPVAARADQGRDLARARAPRRRRRACSSRATPTRIAGALDSHPAHCARIQRCAPWHAEQLSHMFFAAARRATGGGSPTPSADRRAHPARPSAHSRRDDYRETRHGTRAEVEAGARRQPDNVVKTMRMTGGAALIASIGAARARSTSTTPRGLLACLPSRLREALQRADEARAR